MIDNNIKIYNINPTVVSNKLLRCRFKGTYLNDRKSDWAFAHLPVIPMLFEEVVRTGNDWTPDSLLKFLYKEWGNNRPECFDEKMLNQGDEVTRHQFKSRAKKLVLDFCRELHTFALLSRNDFFAHVKYEKANDLSKNLDYSASLVESTEEVGVQASMRHKRYWNDDVFNKLKDARRFARRAGKQFEGPLFYLTNKDIEACICPNTGVWLFTNSHIESLIEDIRNEIGNNFDAEIIGINK